MKRMRLLKTLLSGMPFSHEYLCVDTAAFKAPFRVELSTAHTQKDVTQAHLFIGYKPVLLALPATLFKNDEPARVTLIFYADARKKAGSIQLKKKVSVEGQHAHFYIYEGAGAQHQLLGSAHQWLHKCLHAFKKSKNDALYLNWNAYQQVRLMYSVPRSISLITLGAASRYNIFPTDLHGRLDAHTYLISLRKNGKAHQQVTGAGKITLSTIAPIHWRAVYNLGRNHMQELKPLDDLAFISDTISERYQLPLPLYYTGYLELKEIRQVDCGIHIIHIFNIENTVRVDPTAGRLAHIHQYAAAWRMRHGFNNDYLLNE